AKTLIALNGASLCPDPLLPPWRNYSRFFTGLFLSFTDIYPVITSHPLSVLYCRHRFDKIYNYDRDPRFPRAKTTGKTKEKGRKKTALGKWCPRSIWYSEQQAQQCIDRSFYTCYWHCCFNESNDPRFSCLGIRLA